MSRRGGGGSWKTNGQPHSTSCHMTHTQKKKKIIITLSHFIHIRRRLSGLSSVSPNVAIIKALCSILFTSLACDWLWAWPISPRTFTGQHRCFSTSKILISFPPFWEKKATPVFSQTRIWPRPQAGSPTPHTTCRTLIGQLWKWQTVDKGDKSIPFSTSVNVNYLLHSSNSKKVKVFF